jgi:predicted AlkP superfamily pyrophosphatase or phosphodiesterase
VHTSFPHHAAEEVSPGADPDAFYDWWDHTPKLDRATVALAEEAISALQLGARGHVDYLALGLSQLDRVGHFFGPLSLEQFDALLRVDQLLGEFLDYLDEQVGKDRYVLALTSDHGVVQLPEFRQELGLTGRYVTGSTIQEAYRVARAATAESSGREADRAEVIRRLEMQDYIADVMTIEQLAGPVSADSFVALYQRSYFPGRVPGFLAREGLIVRMTEGVHTDPEPTTHGSPYLYDRHVPLIFVGRGIKPGFNDARVRSVDVAPTLARLAGIPTPEDLDGRPLDPGRN